MRKVFYFTSVLDTYALNRFREESLKMGFKFEVVQYKKISIDFDKNINIRNNKKKLIFKDEDLVILRNPKTKGVDNYSVFCILLDYVKSLKLKAVNMECFLTFPDVRDKLFQYYLLGKNGFSIIKPTYFFGSSEFLSSELDRIKGPLIIKPRNSSSGNGIFLIENRRDFFNKENDILSRNILIQKFIPNDFDLRVICGRDRIIGAMKRSAQKDSLVNNFSAGGTVKEYNFLSEEVSRDCMRICDLFKCHYIGVDLILSGRKYYILEVNFFCHFEGFEKSTNVNFPKEILNMLM